MRRWIGALVLLIAIDLANALAQEEAVVEDEASGRALRERVKALEERLDRLDRVETIKKVEEYLCPDGEIHDVPPPGGRCPDGTIPEGRMTFRKIPFSRRESLDERIAAAVDATHPFAARISANEADGGRERLAFLSDLSSIIGHN